MLWQMGLCLPPSSRCRVAPACWEFSSSARRPWRGFSRSSCSSAFRPDRASGERQGLQGSRGPPPSCAHRATHLAAEESGTRRLLHTSGFQSCKDGSGAQGSGPLTPQILPGPRPLSPHQLTDVLVWGRTQSFTAGFSESCTVSWTVAITTG